MIPEKMVEIPIGILKYLADDIGYYAKDVAKAKSPEVLTDISHDLHITAKFILDLIGDAAL